MVEVCDLSASATADWTAATNEAVASLGVEEDFDALAEVEDLGGLGAGMAAATVVDSGRWLARACS